MKRIITLFLLVGVLTAQAQDDKKWVDKTANKEEWVKHLEYIASDELAGRDTPSEGQEMAAAYLIKNLKSYGVKAFESLPEYRQEVPFVNKKKAKSGIVAVGDKEFKLAEDFVMLNQKAMDWSGQFMIVKSVTEEGLVSADVKGKIVITYCGDGEQTSPQAWFNATRKKSELLKEAGAAGLIEMYNSPQLPFPFLVQYFHADGISLDRGEDSDFLTIWMKESGKETIASFEGNPTGTLRTELGGTVKFTAPNVVGYVEGTDPDLKDQYVVYCAHYDHVGIGAPDAKGDTIYNGARDNGAGTVGVLAAAQNIAKYPTRRSALFVFFTAEEKGLLGSNHFVENLPVPTEKIAFVMNIDNGGYNDTSKATIIGLSRTTEKDKFVEACKAYGLEAIDDPAPEQGLFDRSDNVNFAKKGIPAPDFSMGFTAFDQEIMKYYHQAGDDPDSMDKDYLFKYWRSFILTGRMIANGDGQPFWLEGDKYYEAGKALYNQD